MRLITCCVLACLGFGCDLLDVPRQLDAMREDMKRAMVASIVAQIVDGTWEYRIEYRSDADENVLRAVWAAKASDLVPGGTFENVEHWQGRGKVPVYFRYDGQHIEIPPSSTRYSISDGANELSSMTVELRFLQRGFPWAESDERAGLPPNSVAVDEFFFPRDLHFEVITITQKTNVRSAWWLSLRSYWRPGGIAFRGRIYAKHPISGEPVVIGSVVEAVEFESSS